jgi:protein-S-isoprenylcysteine O-methyltransferase Ste14
MKTFKSARELIPGAAPERQETAAAPPVIATQIFNALVTLACILFAWAHVVGFVQALRLSILIILAKAVLEIQFYVRRSTTPFVSSSVYAWLIALCGTITPLMLRPAADASDFWVGTLIQVIGLGMLIHVVLTFRRNDGVALARLGLRQDGLYRFVRHPICLAFLFSLYGYALNHPTLYNGCVLAIATVFHVLRVNEEERLLREDEEYVRYATEIRWRVIPGVF